MLRSKEIYRSSNYPKRKKWIPIVIVFILIGMVLVFLFRGGGTSNVEEASIPLVNQILQEQYNLDYECEDVTITNDNGDNTYEAKALLNDGSAVNINIEYYPKKDRIYVQIPYKEVLWLN